MVPWYVTGHNCFSNSELTASISGPNAHLAAPWFGLGGAANRSMIGLDFIGPHRRHVARNHLAGAPAMSHPAYAGTTRSGSRARSALSAPSNTERVLDLRHKPVQVNVRTPCDVPLRPKPEGLFASGGHRLPHRTQWGGHAGRAGTPFEQAVFVSATSDATGSSSWAGSATGSGCC